jgi:hypothetical protein
MVNGGQAVPLHGEPGATHDIVITLGLDLDGLATVIRASLGLELAVCVAHTKRRVTAMVAKPSSKEEEYFARVEFEKKKAAEEEKSKKLADGERKKKKELHFMKCPKCGMGLIEIDYKGIKVDKCSACEGIWLDYGELETVIEMDKSGLDKFFSVFRK